MVIRHSSGHEFTQQQIDAIVPILNEHMAGGISKKKFESAVEEACRKAGCPIPDSNIKSK